MFAEKDTMKIGTEYFRVIQISPYTITLQSKNTKHCWHILDQTYYGRSSCLIYHTHSINTSYHLHGHASCLDSAVYLIQNHDRYLLKKNGTLS